MTAPSEPPGETACEACRRFDAADAEANRLAVATGEIHVILSLVEFHHALLADLRQRLERAEAIADRALYELEGAWLNRGEGELSEFASDYLNEARRALSEVRK